MGDVSTSAINILLSLCLIPRLKISLFPFLQRWALANFVPGTGGAGVVIFEGST